MNLHHAVPDILAIERRNGTARQMNASRQCKRLALARHPLSKLALGWWTLVVYNWCRPHRLLQAPLR
jgi:hypothetical protein